MQESDNKPRHAGKHAAPSIEVEKAAQPAPEDEDILLDAYDELGDERDIPLRAAVKKNKKPSAKPKKKRKKRSRRKKRDMLFSEKRFSSRRSIFEIMSATDEDGFFKPLHLFGHELRFWPVFVLLILLLLVGMIVISNGNVGAKTQEVVVVGLPDDLEGYRILLLSDMNGKRFGDVQGALVREVESLGYDMLICAGDMIGEDGDPEPFYEFLDGLSRPSRVYFICGNSDPGPFVDKARDIEGTLDRLVLEDWILGAIDRGAHYIDAPTCIEVGEAKLWLTPTTFLNLEASAYRSIWQEQMEQEEDGVISGLSSDYDTLPFTSYRYALAQKLYSAVQNMSSTDMVIGLSHAIPDDDFIRSAATHDGNDGKYLFEPELIIAGHYCGGVWKLPFIGTVYVPNNLLPRHGWFPAKEDVEGLSRVGESQVYITNGLSTTASIPVLPFRLLNSPEVVQLKLSAKLPDNMLEMK